MHGVGAIVTLSKRKFCVDSIVTIAKSQAGHHHTQHGSMQKSSKKMKRQQQDLEAAATWKAVYNLGGHHPQSAPTIAIKPISAITELIKRSKCLLLQAKGPVEQAAAQCKLDQYNNMLVQWQEESTKNIKQVADLVSQMPDGSVKDVGLARVCEMQQALQHKKRMPSASKITAELSALQDKEASNTCPQGSPGVSR